MWFVFDSGMCRFLWCDLNVYWGGGGIDEMVSWLGYCWIWLWGGLMMMVLVYVLLSEWVIDCFMFVLDFICNGGDGIVVVWCVNGIVLLVC